LGGGKRKDRLLGGESWGLNIFSSEQRKKMCAGGGRTGKRRGKCMTRVVIEKRVPQQTHVRLEKAKRQHNRKKQQGGKFG